MFCFPRWNAGGWLAWAAFVPLLWGSARLSGRAAALWGILAGLIANGGTLYWVYPTCRWGGVPVPAALAAVFLLSAYLALYWSAFAWAARLFFRRAGWGAPFLGAAAWTALELLRAHLLTGFPWLLLGYSQWLVPTHFPLARIGGGYAISFLVMLANGTLAVLLLALAGRRRRAWAAVPGAAAVAALAVYSIVLWNRPSASAGLPVRLSVVQGNIDQYKKWNAAYEREIVTAYAALTREAARERPAMILWPETSVPAWVPNHEDYTRWVQETAKEAGVFLVAGAPSRQERKDYNAAFLFSPDGEFAGQYRKQHLVPFGEFVPLQGVLGRVVRVLNELGSFSSGPGAEILRGPVDLGVNICFESLFPHLVRRFSLAGATVLGNLTNDGWYRDTAAPEQHLAVNVFRAVENGRWMVRAANTGISAFINPRGEIVARSALLERAVLTADVEPVSTLTFYSRFGDVFAYGMALVTVLGIFGASFRREKN